MKKILSLILLISVLTTQFIFAEPVNPKVVLITTKGRIVLELNISKAPLTTANFVKYVKTGYYNGLIFHRVIKRFMIQGGGLKQNMGRKSAGSSVLNEADNGLNNDKYTIAMARTSAPHSATSQFFINTKNNSFLNFRSKSRRGWGYCVFGKVIKGFSVVDSIESTNTTSRMGHRNVPVQHIIIKRDT